MNKLDEVLKKLNEAEKEYKEKCLKYGIEEKTKKKKETVDEKTVSDNEQVQ